MNRKAIEIKKGDQVMIAGKKGLVDEVEISDVGKQGTKKVRLVVKIGDEKVVIIRPEDYPFQVL